MDEIAGRYRGLHLVYRLQHAATVLPAPQASRALGLALDVLKKSTQATELYKAIANKPGARQYHAYDAAWVEEADNRAAAKMSAIERQINTETANMIRENIRVSFAHLSTLS